MAQNHLRPSRISRVTPPGQEPYRYSYVYSSRRPVRAVQPETKGRITGKYGILTILAPVLAALLVIGGIRLAHVRARELPISSRAFASTAATKSSKLSPAAVADPALAQSLNNIISRYPDLEVGVNLVSVADGKTATYGVSDPYIAASVDKLLTATTYLHQVDTGQAALGQKLEDGNTAQTDLEQLITNSDNDAWASLNDYLTFAQIKAYASSIGLNSYDADNNIIAPADVAQLLYKLYANKLLGASSRSLLLSYMHRANYTGYIMDAVPKGVTAYHKVGILNDRVNDAAILDNGKTAYVLVIFSKSASGNYDYSQGQQLFHDLTVATTKQLL